MDVVVMIVGVVVVALVTIDLISSTLGKNGGPITGPMLRGVAWMLRSMPGTRRHRCHSRVGSWTTLGLITGWLLAMVAGWAMVLQAAQPAMTDVEDAEVSVADDWLFAVSTLGGLGNGRIRLQADHWILVRTVASLMGTVFVGLVVSFVIPVIQASSAKRALARRLGHVGDEELKRRLVEESSLKNELCWRLLEQQEAHVTYPSLGLHFESEPERDAAYQLVRLSCMLERTEDEGIGELRDITRRALAAMATMDGAEPMDVCERLARTAGWAEHPSLQE